MILGITHIKRETAATLAYTASYQAKPQPQLFSLLEYPDPEERIYRECGTSISN